MDKREVAMMGTVNRDKRAMMQAARRERQCHLITPMTGTMMMAATTRTATANAAMGSLQRMPQDELGATAARYGIPIDAELAEAVAAHFEQRRNAVLRYRR